MKKLIEQELINKFQNILNEKISYKFITNNKIINFVKKYLNSIPKEDKEKSLIYYNWNLYRECFISLNYNKILNEDIKHSNSIISIKKRLQEEFNINDWQLNIVDLQNHIKGISAEYNNKNINLIIPKLKENRNIIISILKQEGYYLMQETPSILDKDTNINFIMLIFAPLYTDNITDSIIKKYKYLYHITPKSNLTNILSQGLIPIKSDKIIKYPERIYVFLENDLNRCRDYALNLYNFNNKNKECVIIKINIEKMKDNIPNFYQDPALYNAYYTDEKIYPEYLEIYEIVNLDNYIPSYEFAESEENIETENIIKDICLNYNVIRDGYKIISDNKLTLEAVFKELKKQNIDVDNNVGFYDNNYFIICMNRFK